MILHINAAQIAVTHIRNRVEDCKAKEFICEFARHLSESLMIPRPQVCYVTRSGSNQHRINGGHR